MTNKNFSKECAELAAYMVAAVVKSNLKNGNSDEAYELMNQMVANSPDPAAAKIFYEFIMDGAAKAFEKAAA
jgi:hypothetical protein